MPGEVFRMAPRFAAGKSYTGFIPNYHFQCSLRTGRRLRQSRWCAKLGMKWSVMAWEPALWVGSRKVETSRRTMYSTHSGLLGGNPPRATPAVYTFRTVRVYLQRSAASPIDGPSARHSITRQRNDRQADFRCGANPQRGVLSCHCQLPIFNPSRAFLPPDTAGSVIDASAICDLIPELCTAGIAAASRVPEASQVWVEGGGV